MSERAFTEAKSDLAFSQQLRDKKNMAQPQAGMGGPEDMQPPIDEMQENGVTPPVEKPVEEEKTGIINAVKEVVQPMFDQIKSLLTKKDEKPKEVEIKIEGEMKPKEETSN